MPDPIGSRSLQPQSLATDDADPNMSVDPSVSGGVCSAPPAGKAAPPPRPSAAPSSGYALTSGTAVLVSGHTKLTATGSLGVIGGAGPGNVGAHVEVASGSVVIDSSVVPDTVSISASGGSAEINVGTRNVDGSTGAHIKAGVAVVSGEITVGSPTLQLSMGAGLGPSVEASSGERDIDGDGHSEYCLRAGLTVVGGVCVEPGQIVEDLSKGVSMLTKLVTLQRTTGIPQP